MLSGTNIYSKQTEHKIANLQEQTIKDEIEWLNHFIRLVMSSLMCNNNRGILSTIHSASPISLREYNSQTDVE